MLCCEGSNPCPIAHHCRMGSWASTALCSCLFHMCLNRLIWTLACVIHYMLHTCMAQYLLAVDVLCQLARQVKQTDATLDEHPECRSTLLLNMDLKLHVNAGVTQTKTSCWHARAGSRNIAQAVAFWAQASADSAHGISHFTQKGCPKGICWATHDAICAGDRAVQITDTGHVQGRLGSCSLAHHGCCCSPAEFCEVKLGTDHPQALIMMVAKTCTPES